MTDCVVLHTVDATRQPASITPTTRSPRSMRSGTCTKATASTLEHATPTSAHTNTHPSACDHDSTGRLSAGSTITVDINSHTSTWKPAN